jgi:hypothetical protein
MGLVVSRAMGKFYMLAGGMVEPGAANPGAVSAFVAYNPSSSVSRLFKVEGPADKPRVLELPAATTVDLGRFRTQVHEELGPVVSTIVAGGGTSSIVSPKADWVNAIVQEYIDTSG